MLLRIAIVSSLAAAACSPLPAEPAPGEPAPTAVWRVDQNGIDWNGVDWNGVDWNGVDWNGIDWNGIDWNGIDWNGIDWNGIDWNGVDWNGIDWNGIDWNGVDWNSVDWNSVDGNGIDWNGIDWSALDWNAVDWPAIAPTAVDWSAVDWSAVDVTAVVGAAGGVRRVHPLSRPLFFFVTATSGGQTFPLAIPSPGARRILDTAARPAAAAHLLEKSFEIAYGPGFRALIGSFDIDGDGDLEPLVAHGRLGLAPSLVGLGPYDEAQVMAWSSVIGNLLNVQPFQLSLRAHDVDAMQAGADELDAYRTVDLRGAIGRLLPPPWAPDAPPVMILLRERLHWVSIDTGGIQLQDQLDQRRACPMDEAASWTTCYGGAVHVVNLLAARLEGLADCEAPAPSGPYTGAVTGRCWVNLPGLTFEQDAAVAPITASFVDGRLVCPTCPPSGPGGEP